MPFCIIYMLNKNLANYLLNVAEMQQLPNYFWLVGMCAWDSDKTIKKEWQGKTLTSGVKTDQIW